MLGLICINFGLFLICAGFALVLIGLILWAIWLLTRRITGWIVALIVKLRSRSNEASAYNRGFKAGREASKCPYIDKNN